MTQRTLTTDDTDNEDNAVWIVAGTYADDPHPHILGVYAEEEEEQADDLMERCRDPTRSPQVDTWDKTRHTVQDAD